MTCLCTSYAKDKTRLSEAQKGPYEKYLDAEQIIAMVKNETTDEYKGIKELSDDIAQAMQFISTQEAILKESPPSLESDYKEIIVKAKERLAQLMKLARGEEITLPKPTMTKDFMGRDREVYILPDQEINKVLDSGIKFEGRQELESRIFRLKEAKNKVRNNREYDAIEKEITELKEEKRSKLYAYALRGVDTKFTTPEEAFEYYKKSILPELRVDAKAYAEYFNASRNLGKYYSQVMNNASLKDKQFIAHRKNYTERLLREEIRSGAKNGMKTLSIPTPRTLALIEGYFSSDGVAPYEILTENRRYEDQDLEEGDRIMYLDEEHIVLSQNSTDIEVVESDSGEVTDGQDLIDQLMESNISDTTYEFESAIGTETEFTADSWNEFVNANDLWSLSSSVEDYSTQDRFDEESDETYYTIDTSLVDESIRGYHQEDYLDVKDTLDMFFSEVYDLEDGTYFVTQQVVYPETLKQPDQYEGTTDLGDFNIDNMTDTEQTILRKYEVLIDFFKKERLDASIFTDEKGNEWLRTDLTEDDGVKPIVSFQAEGAPRPKQASIKEKIENTSSIFDSQLELLDLYSREEELSIKRDIDSCGR